MQTNGWRISVGAGTLRRAASWVAFAAILGGSTWVSIPAVVTELRPAVADVVATTAVIIGTTALTEAHFVGEE